MDKMLKIVLRHGLYRYEQNSNFYIDVSQKEYEADPGKVREVPDTAFWRMQASWADDKRQYDIVYEPEKKAEKVKEVIVPEQPKPAEPVEKKVERKKIKPQEIEK